MSNDTLCPWTPPSSGLGLWGWLNPRWHCLSLLGTLLLPVPCQGTHSARPHHAPEPHTDTSAPAGLLSTVLPGGHGVTDTAQSCQHLHMAGAGDSHCSASWDLLLIPAFGTNIKGDGFSRKSINKLPNYFLNIPLLKITITKYKNSDITHAPTLLFSVQQKVPEKYNFQYILLKYMPELSYLNHCEKLKPDLIMAIFRIPHEYSGVYWIYPRIFRILGCILGYPGAFQVTQLQPPC